MGVKLPETIEIALRGMLFAILVRAPLAVLSARNLTPHPILAFPARGVVSFFRAIPELISVRTEAGSEGSKLHARSGNGSGVSVRRSQSAGALPTNGPRRLENKASSDTGRIERRLILRVYEGRARNASDTRGNHCNGPGVSTSSHWTLVASSLQVLGRRPVKIVRESSQSCP